MDQFFGFGDKYIQKQISFSTFAHTTLQIPTQGIGEWCHPTSTATIDDAGIRKNVQNNVLQTKLGVPFHTPSTGKNIAFTSHWDNFQE